MNYRANCAIGEVFVKSYPPGTDLEQEARAIELSELARRNRIPSTAVLRNHDGQTIDATTSLPVSIWQWVPGRVVTELNTSQYEQAGDALGRLHALFVKLPVNSTSNRKVDEWRDIDLDDLAATVDALLGIITSRRTEGILDAFDTVAERTLLERRQMLPRIPELLADLPGNLAVQLLHGDYSPVNLLWVGDELAAVINFSPPDPFLLAYDLGRMAFYPNTVTGDPQRTSRPTSQPIPPSQTSTSAPAAGWRRSNSYAASTGSSSTTRSQAYSRPISTSSGSSGMRPPHACSDISRRWTRCSTT
ncbi:phosphotransferase [Planotetraspora kaengkrachanensis]|uniref:phosphotransferase n=1 Tax=Planotetraspora kaengkrachanensis TaxID=575193 RepID=UPI0019455423